ncbi:DUF3160 domain-containing protein [Gemmatimonadota bacterium]
MQMFYKMTGALLLMVLTAGQLPAGGIAVIDQPVTTEFGTYNPVAISKIAPSVPDITVAADFSNVAYFDRYRELQEEEPRGLLASNHFVAIPGQFKQIHDLYNYARDAEVPIFVTTDAMLHTFHIIYDYALRILETELFQYDLQALNDALLQAVSERNSGDPVVAEELRRVVAFVNVARRLASPESSVLTEVTELVEAELKLIEAHEGPDYSPIMSYQEPGYREDYSQYVPRGHYTRSEALKNYFMSMMWYGRMGFRLKPENSEEGIEKGREETRMALNLVSTLAGLTVAGESALDVWERIYRPTVFFVGEADDLTVYDYARLAETVYGKQVKNLTPDEIAESDLLDKFREQAAEWRAPEINSSLVADTQNPSEVTQGFRVMGQRFIPDSYMFWQLVHPNVNSRLFPRGLDVMAVLGSGEAETILREVYNETAYPDYQPKLDSLKTEFSDLSLETWAKNLYYNWLYCLVPLFEEKSAGYPRFMQSRAWTRKSLSTALGSWAELRHDTILYAKQSYTLETSIPPPPEPVGGYVEPVPGVFARLAALARYMRASLDARGLLHDEIDWRLAEFESLQLSLKLIAERHLANTALTSVEKEVILNIGEQLERLVTFPPSEEGQQSWENDTDNEMAVIADVHTDPNSAQVLEVGVGYPLALYVIVPGSQGPVLALGGMFSYYEFKHPMNDRLTDEAWQEMLHAGEAPDTPEWADDFLSFEGTETVTEHLGKPVENPTISRLLLETETQVINSGDMLEVWITTHLTEGLEVRFWADDQLLEQSGLDPDSENEGMVSTTISTENWPSGVVRAEVLYQGESLRNTFLEIVSPVFSPADLDNDGRVSVLDLIALLDLLSQGEGPDINSDGSGNIFDLLDMLLLLCESSQDSTSPEVLLSALGECTSGSEKDPDTRSAYGSDELEIEVGESTLRFTHRNAVFNCCMDSVGLALERDKQVIRVLETEHTALACRCICEFTVYGEIVDLSPGEYTVEVVNAVDPEMILCTSLVTVP